jgi:Universal stress protein family
LEPHPILSEGIAERELERLVQQQLTSSSSCRIMARRGDPASIIVTVAEELKVDLIVMPTHGHKGIERMILGSVAERIAREARRPVLTIRLSYFSRLWKSATIDSRATRSREGQMIVADLVTCRVTRCKRHMRRWKSAGSDRFRWSIGND